MVRRGVSITFRHDVQSCIIGTLMLQRILSPYNCSRIWPPYYPLGWLPAILLPFFLACSLPPAKVHLPGPQPIPGGASQMGVASWYGPGFHGHPTASGAIYNQFELTAAHQTLPLGSQVIVTNLDNGRSVEVSVNDRGPFMKGRIIDLSYAAANALGMVEPGTIPVRIELVERGFHRIRTIRANLDYSLQLGSFVEVENALELKGWLSKNYPWVKGVSIILFRGKDSLYYRVQMGIFPERREAEDHAQQLAREGIPTIIMEN